MKHSSSTYSYCHKCKWHHRSFSPGSENKLSKCVSEFLLQSGVIRYDDAEEEHRGKLKSTTTAQLNWQDGRVGRGGTELNCTRSLIDGWLPVDVGIPCGWGEKQETERWNVEERQRKRLWISTGFVGWKIEGKEINEQKFVAKRHDLVIFCHPHNNNSQNALALANCDWWHPLKRKEKKSWEWWRLQWGEMWRPTWNMKMFRGLVCGGCAWSPLLAITGWTPATLRACSQPQPVRVKETWAWGKGADTCEWNVLRYLLTFANEQE